MSNTIKEINEKLSSKFEKEREDWKSDYKHLLTRFKTIDHMQDSIVSIASYRHLFSDKRINMKNILIDIEKDYEYKFAEYLKEYSETPSLRDKYYTFKEKESVIKGILLGRRKRIELVKNHIEFYGEVISGLDKLNYHVKMMVDLEKIKLGL